MLQERRRELNEWKDALNRWSGDHDRLIEMKVGDKRLATAQLYRCDDVCGVDDDEHKYEEGKGKSRL